MNILAPPQPRLSVEIVFDLVCPWCYLGIRRLMRVLTERHDLQPDLHWRPFLLNPEIAPGGIPRQDWLARKFGGEDRARRLHGTITDLGRAEGIEFRFDLLRRIPASLDAHRLLRWAGRQASVDRLVERLFAAYFCEGLDIGQNTTLAALAGEEGFDSAAALRFLGGAGETEWVHLENLRAHRLGINGVPCFLVDGEHAIAGAQEAEVLERLIEVALAAG
ncbi:DsbA family oxidoreductase [Sediminicoccus sp. KRV36]|uniref:DsbA family oxidoreductase n=1 Tax=Sediminicoccus sp. KRV36 TaxID=3133721 RepID=UPI0020102666|nr:DsbA family oxidoreductase [Sediminicoccus rosea]UPY35557.1 DsbA family oxidoreductase [Sediminicoccus rosea]